jgi:hypothetical protein
MKENKLVVFINAPIDRVFSFTITPPNSTLWIPGIIEEKTSEWPIQPGSVYKLTNESGENFEVTVEALGINKYIEWISEDLNYHCRYSYKKLNENATELEYLEWVDDGILENPFTTQILEKLKNVLEA